MSFQELHLALPRIPADILAEFYADIASLKYRVKEDLDNFDYILPTKKDGDAHNRLANLKSAALAMQKALNALGSEERNRLLKAADSTPWNMLILPIESRQVKQLLELVEVAQENAIKGGRPRDTEGYFIAFYVALAWVSRGLDDFYKRSTGKDDSAFCIAVSIIAGRDISRTTIKRGNKLADRWMDE